MLFSIKFGGSLHNHLLEILAGSFFKTEEYCAIKNEVCIIKTNLDVRSWFSFNLRFNVISGNTFTTQQFSNKVVFFIHRTNTGYQTQLLYANDFYACRYLPKECTKLRCSVTLESEIIGKQFY